MRKTTKLFLLAVAALLITTCTTTRSPNADCCEIQSVDQKTGTMQVRVLDTGEVVELPATPEMLKGIATGQKVSQQYMANASAGLHCKCGKRADGSCWCSSVRGDLCYSRFCPRVVVTP